ncbi:MAG: LysE family translocator [Gammaproteobacteria bacterium]
MFEFLLPLFSFAIYASITPGPNSIMVAASGANFGFRRTLPHIAGVAVGLSLLLLAIGFGMSTFVHQFSLLHDLLTALAIFYLLFLAYKMAITNNKFHKNSEMKQQAKPLTFVQASIFQWANPKAWMVSVSAISTFTTVGSHFTAEILVIGSIFALATAPSIALWVLLGARIGKILNPSLGKI